MARVELGLDDDEVVAAAAAPGGATLIAVGDIQGNPENPRPQDTDIKGTAADLKSRGQLQNLNVMTRAVFLERKPHLAGQLGPQPYVAVNGNLRVAAAPVAGLAALKSEIHDEWTEDDIDEAVVAENEHRTQVNHLMLGQHLARMLPRYGSQHKLAAALNKTQPWVQQHIALTKLHPDLQQRVLADTLPFKLTRECGRLHGDLQPLLASGELPEAVATAWLLELRIKPSEQWALWQTGPPYLPVDQPAEPADDEGQDDAKAGEPAPTKPRPIVIRIGEWSAPMVVRTLRDQLTETQWGELVREITRS